MTNRSVCLAVVVGGLVLLAGVPVGAQGLGQPELPPAAVAFNVSLARLDGFGARAFGLGGAFTAVADDATAASWNPAGLAQLPEKQLQAGFGYLSRESRKPTDFDVKMRLGNPQFEANAYTVSMHGERGFEPASSFYPDFFTAAVPIALGADRLVVSVSYFRVDTFFEDQGTEGNDVVFHGLSAQNALQEWRVSDYSTRFEQDGKSQTVNGSVAYNFRERLLVGATLSYVTTDYTKSSMANLVNYYLHTEGFGDTGLGTLRREDVREVKAKGLFGTLGVQYRVTPKVTLGATYRMGSKLNLTYSESSRFEASFRINNGEPEGQKAFSVSDDSDVTTADAFSVGLAFRPRLNWVVAVDYSSADWSDVTYKAKDINGKVTEYYYPSLQPKGTGITGVVGYKSRQYRDTTFRVGSEWTFSVGDSYLPVRLGYYREDGMSSFPGADQPTVTGYTTGLGLQTSGRLFADLAIVYDTVTAKAKTSSAGQYFDSGLGFWPLPFLDTYTQLVALRSGESIEQNTWRGVLSVGFRF